MSAPGGGPPGDWLGLLKWSLKHQDGTNDNPELRDMSEDKRKWLEKVMQDSFVDVVKQLKECLDELEFIASEASSKEGGGPLSSERAVELWQDLMDQTENIDNALTFCQIGGLPTLFRYLGPLQSVEPGLCSAALAVLACLTQNNPPVQQQVLAEHDPLPVLTAIANRDDAQPRQVAKAVAALSCTVRGQHEAEEALLSSEQGLQVFHKCLASSDLRVRQKALFLLQALVGADRAGQERADKVRPLLPAVVRALADEDIGVRSSAMGVIGATGNRLGTEALKAGEVGLLLSQAMATRRSAIAALQGVDRQEAQEEERFWGTLEQGGVFLRDGEQEAPPVPPAQQPPQPPQAAQEETQASQPVLLLAPAELSGASKAP